MRKLLEIAAYPPPMGSWSLRIEFVVRRWLERGYMCSLLNIGPSRSLNNPDYINVKGSLDYIIKVVRFVRRGYIIHTHTNAKGVKGTLLALCAQFISICFGRRCVLTFHAGVNQEYFPRTGRFILDNLMFLAFKTPQYIICNSDAVKKCIIEDYCIPENKIFPIPAFCEAYMRTNIGNLPEPVHHFFERHRPILVSYVFFFHPEFAVDDMIHAVECLRKEYKDLGLIIMGSKQYAEEYITMINDLGLSDNILLTGNLPREAFLGVLRSATLYLRTPMGDGVAASVLESLSLGVPVVASDNGTRPAGCILYPSRKLDIMIEKIRYVIENRENVISRIQTPQSRDTIEEEIDLLLSV